MRTSALLVSALLSTGIAAHPLIHSHHKRDDDAKLVNSYTKDGKLYQEYVKTVTVYAGQGPADNQPQPQVQAAAPVSVPSPSPSPVKQQKVEQPAPVVQQKNADPSPTPSPTPTPSPKAQTPAKSDTTADASSGGSCDGEAAGGDAFTASSCSGGKTIIDQFNEMRAQWDPSLANHKYTWDATLAQNARSTAIDPQAENGAEEMKHKLFPGSMGQCIAGSFGGDKTFYKAAKMWMCEIKQGPFCDEQTYGVGDDKTGHADIIKSLSYTKVGCYYMYKDNDKSSNSAMYTCDFA